VIFFVRTVFTLIFILILTGGIFLVLRVEKQVPEISYNEFLQSLEHGEVNEVSIRGNTVFLQDTYGRHAAAYVPEIGSIVPKLLSENVRITGKSDNKPFLWIIGFTLPTVVILLAWYSMLRKPATGKKNEDFGRKNVVSVNANGQNVTFRDVAGIPEVKDDLLEIIDFLQKPKKYSRLGAITPKGILFQGPPGTGKTLLARAVAGEAGVPFYSISGSDFVEMFVGVGASRVRELFAEAKKNAPAIIFIDEIDAVGGHRAAGGSTAGGDERGQTLNALLVELDGFSSDETVIVLAATNRPDILDPALLRPGRFDRQINILPPDIKGRIEILHVFARKVPLAGDVQLESIAGSTPGFTGAELASLVNEAAIYAGRQGKKTVDNEDFEVAKDRIMMGVERKGMVITPEDKQTIAFHEAGHAILANLLPETDPVHKVSIIPRGQALGHTQQQPLADRHAYSKVYLTSRVITLLGGRAAEDLLLKQQTTFAEDDFEQAAGIATKMVCRWGMSDTLGHVSYSSSDGGFLGDQMHSNSFGEEASREIDREIKRIIEDSYAKALEILQTEKDFLVNLAEALLVNETLDHEEMEIVHRCTIHKRQGRAGDCEAVTES
jgi:cell division protease FtsH